MSNEMSHLFNLDVRHGVERLTGFQIRARYGRDVFESEHVEHSEWCHCVTPMESDPPF